MSISTTNSVNLDCVMVIVVSIGRLTAFYIVFVPLEYIPCEPPHGNYAIVSFVLYKRLKEGAQVLAPPAHGASVDSTGTCTCTMS